MQVEHKTDEKEGKKEIKKKYTHKKCESTRHVNAKRRPLRAGFRKCGTYTPRRQVHGEGTRGESFEEVQKGRVGLKGGLNVSERGSSEKAFVRHEYNGEVEEAVVYTN